MNHLGHTLDTVILSTVTLAVSASAVVMEPSDDIELRLVLLPLIGGVIVSGSLIMLNPQPETRRIVIGRALIALFLSVVLPQTLGYFFPVLAAMVRKPMPLLMAGGVISGLTYVISKPFTRELYNRAEGVAKKQADRLERMVDNNQEPPPPAVVEVTVSSTPAAK
jgi:hypothetical protein